MDNIFDISSLSLPEIKFYLYYDNDGNILELLDYKKDNGNYIEVSEQFVVEFRESGKEFHSYSLEIDDKPKIIKKLENVQIGQLFKILTMNSLADFIISVTSTKMIFKIREFDPYSNISDNFEHFFFIVDNNDLNFLKKTVIIKHKDLKQGYELDYNFILRDESILTKKYFESYGLSYD